MNDAVCDSLERHFDTAFAAPDGIKKLRELILTLAMQGKLVAQDPNDPPASQLLKEIEAEKKRLVKEGKIKAPKPLPEIKPEDVPYVLPQGWEWVRMGEIGYTNIGLTYTPSNVSETGIPVLRSNNIQNGKLDLSDLKRVDVKVKESIIVHENDLLICARNGSKALVGKTALITGLSEEMAFGAFMAIFRSRFNQYLLRFINSPLFRKMIDEVNTMTINQITQDNLRSTICPLPPLPEQHRIVAKIDQLMARCDELEKLRDERKQKRRSAHAAAIKQLLDESSSPAFASSRLRASNFFNHFSELYTVKENVTELRKAILQLAVMGKLVPQNPNDPPASQLLKEIEAEKKRLVKGGKIKAPKSLPEIKPGEVPYALPQGWEWVRISRLAESIDYGTSEKTGGDSSLVPVYRMGNIVDGCLIDEGFKYIAPDIDDLPRLYLKRNDILFNRTNSYELVGKSAIYLGPENYATFASYLICIRVIDEYLFPTYISTAMNAPYFRSTQIEPEIVQQCGQANFNGTKLSLCLIPLPPLPEQHRIVTKIDSLMSLCDTLEQQIDAAARKQTALLDAVMAQV